MFIVQATDLLCIIKLVNFSILVSALGAWPEHARVEQQWCELNYWRRYFNKNLKRRNNINDFCNLIKLVI